MLLVTIINSLTNREVGVAVEEEVAADVAVEEVEVEEDIGEDFVGEAEAEEEISIPTTNVLRCCL